MAMRGGCWLPAGSHKPGHAGSIPAPATKHRLALYFGPGRSAFVAEGYFGEVGSTPALPQHACRQRRGPCGRKSRAGPWPGEVAQTAGAPVS